ncbi:MAG TPA: orotate phosphoribosyltransferase [Clostridia bacterium]|nr:orotate phosphoribosyltransferase [Clostridia bacterium]
MPYTVARAQLLTLLAQQSFRLGQFKLSSGGTSDYYIDCRTTTLHAEGARLTASVFYDEIKHHGWKPSAIGGLTMGADPIAVAVSMLSAQLHQPRASRGAPFSDDRMIHAFLVRKAEKAHGTGQRIEGFREKGSPVVIVDDVCTTGGSTVQAIEAARDFGFEVVGAMCLVEREDAKGRPAVERAAAPAPFVSIFTAQEIRTEHLRLFPREAELGSPTPLAASGKCELCDRAAVTGIPGRRCEVHRTA